MSEGSISVVSTSLSAAEDGVWLSTVDELVGVELELVGSLDVLLLELGSELDSLMPLTGLPVCCSLLDGTLLGFDETELEELELGFK